MPSPPSDSHRPVRVFFPCTGLGRQQRGFETFTLQCASALADDTRLDLTVFSGGKLLEFPSRVIANVGRDSPAAHWLSTVHRRGAYFSEQLTFFVAFLPLLMRGRPDVVYFADLNLGNLCWHWRRLTGQRYRLLYYNGGLTTKPFTRADLVQQLTPQGVDEAIERGEDPGRQILLPHGVEMPERVPVPLTPTERVALGLPADRQIVLSVGLLDSSVKRMDYLVREMSALGGQRPFLVILGAESPETPAIRALASSLLGAENVLLRTVDGSLISSYYRAADVFALASLREGFGLAYVEALAHGLPIIAHDFPVTRYLLNDLADLSDLSRAGTLTAALARQLQMSSSAEARCRRHASAHARFSWGVLRAQYSDMLRAAAMLPVPGIA